VEAYANPYQAFIDVLAHRYAGAQRKALTGDLIAVYAEFNHLLGRTKGKLAVAVWAGCADELLRCMSLYESAWRRFAAEVGKYVSGDDVDVPSSSSLGPETTQAFQEVLDGLWAALDVLRRESRLVGCEAWVY
jgi:hypothetical protein